MRPFPIVVRIVLSTLIGCSIVLLGAEAIVIAFLLAVFVVGIGFVAGSVVSAIPIRSPTLNGEEDDYRELLEP